MTILTGGLEVMKSESQGEYNLINKEKCNTFAVYSVFYKYYENGISGTITR